MELSENEILAVLSEHLPQFERAGSLVALQGGNLNDVWRLRGNQRNMIIKHAPPYIASNPDIPLSSDRIDFEARALKLFESAGKLHEVTSEQVRPPQCLLYDPEKSLLVMEDIGSVPSIDSWLSDHSDPTPMGSSLGRFIGLLHKKSLSDAHLAELFNNIPIQETRNQVQYQPAADYVHSVTSTIDTDIKTQFKALGNELLTPGKCLVMGDLWPASILIANKRLRLIDWEFVHFGRPLQDVGHFAAHCWMQAHTASSPHQTDKWEQLWASFWNAYRQATDDCFEELFDTEEHAFMNTHIAAEILVRTVGPFKEGYVYEHFPPAHPKIKEAVKSALEISERQIFSFNGTDADIDLDY